MYVFYELRTNIEEKRLKITRKEQTAESKNEKKNTQS